MKYFFTNGLSSPWSFASAASIRPRPISSPSIIAITSRW